MGKLEIGQIDRMSVLAQKSLQYVQHSKRIYPTLAETLSPEDAFKMTMMYLTEWENAQGEMLTELAHLHILETKGSKPFEDPTQVERLTAERLVEIEAMLDEVYNEAANSIREQWGL